jgi:hypothetical protein
LFDIIMYNFPQRSDFKCEVVAFRWTFNRDFLDHSKIALHNLNAELNCCETRSFLKQSLKDRQIGAEIKTKTAVFFFLNYFSRIKAISNSRQRLKH